MPRPTSRVVRYQYRPGGIVHLAVTKDSVINRVLHSLVTGPTLCGKVTRIREDGWGYSRSSSHAEPKLCPTCWKDGAPAEPRW